MGRKKSWKVWVMHRDRARSGSFFYFNGKTWPATTMLQIGYVEGVLTLTPIKKEKRKVNPHE